MKIFGVLQNSKHKGRERDMAKIERWIANLKVAGKLKAYRLIVLIMTVFFVLVTLISTLVIRSNVGGDYGGVVSGGRIYTGIGNNDL